MVKNRRKKSTVGKTDKNFFWILAGIALSAVLLDQLSKFFIRSFVILNDRIVVVNDFFYVSNVQNTGVAFSFLHGNVWIPIWLSVIAVGVILFFHDRIKTTAQAVFVGLIAGGILGNFIDRLAFGAVTDFIDFSFWPAFNVADSCLTIGIIGLIVLLWKE